LVRCLQRAQTALQTPHRVRCAVGEMGLRQGQTRVLRT